MDHLRLLYKANNSILSPKINKRKVANELRATKRSELYTSTRNISPSPPPDNAKQIGEDQKENFKPPAPVVSKTTNPQPPSTLPPPSMEANEKLSKKKAYLMKFLAWKAEKGKEAQLKEQSSKKAPFVVPLHGAQAIETRSMKKSFAPKNHTFKPPENLKDLTLEVVGKNSIRCVYGEQKATYHFVETPKKKKPVLSKAEQAMSLAAKSTLATKPPVARPVTHKTPNPLKPIQVPSVAEAVTKARFQTIFSAKKTPAPASKPVSKPASASKPKPAPLPQKPKSMTKPEVIARKAPVESKTHPPVAASKPTAPAKPVGVAKPIGVTKPLQVAPQKPKMPPPSQQVPRFTRRAISSNVAPASSKPASSKSGLHSLKRPTFKAPKKANGSSISNAFLTVNGNNRPKAANVQSALKLCAKPGLRGKAADPIAETPTDTASSDSVMKFVTSTKRKSSSSKGSNSDLLFADLVNTISPVDVTPAAKQSSSKKSDNKFSFIRYSLVQADSQNETKKEEKPAEQEAANVTAENIAEPPTTYMSPFVSVSRGKVSTKIEKEKRNSIYMAGEASATPEATLAERRILATVRYYRKQLTDEINRLNDMCIVWEEYKKANPDITGLDMVDATIGQTRLLITKKLKQFAGLIDRCEDGLLGKSSAVSGDGEGAKPILPEDLEGFWSMVGLQIDNVDKRFDNIRRWKENNWNDPDEVPVKAAVVKKIKKKKPIVAARPNGALQKMLKTAHAAYLNKKTVPDTDTDVVILTPSQKRQVLIKDRRSRSAAATVITVHTPRNRRSIEAKTDANETPKLIPHINGFRKSMNLFKTALDRKSPANDYVSPLRQSSRKSILKTPGSKCKPKSVIFNSPALKFTFDDAVEEANSNLTHTSGDEEEDQMRTYQLRNRRVVLRDSAEFEIPH